MKANPRQRRPRISPTAVTAACGAAVLAVLLAGGCATRRPAPPAPPPPIAKPSPAPALPRPAADWRRAPITPGDWRWSMEGGASVARFAGGQLVLRCDLAARTVTLLRAGAADVPVPMSISTTALTRPFMGAPVAGPPPAIAATFAARDPLLDAMAFSRGRFAVDVAGLQPLYVPSWTEVSRVIEDCR